MVTITLNMVINNSYLVGLFTQSTKGNIYFKSMQSLKRPKGCQRRPFDNSAFSKELTKYFEWGRLQEIEGEMKEGEEEGVEWQNKLVSIEQSIL